MRGLEIQRNETLELFKMFLKDVGLDVPDTLLEIYQAPPTTPDIRLYLALRIPVVIPYSELELTNKPHVNFFRKLYDQVRDGDIVRREKEEIQTKLTTAEDTIKGLLKEIDSLKKYKVHHDLEMELRHGKK